MPDRIGLLEAEEHAYQLLTDKALSFARLVSQYGTKHPHYEARLNEYQAAHKTWKNASEALAGLPDM